MTVRGRAGPRSIRTWTSPTRRLRLLIRAVRSVAGSLTSRCRSPMRRRCITMWRPSMMVPTGLLTEQLVIGIGDVDTPLLDPIADVVVDEGDQVSVAINAIDPNGDPITLVLASTPDIQALGAVLPTTVTAPARSSGRPQRVMPACTPSTSPPPTGQHRDPDIHHHRSNRPQRRRRCSGSTPVARDRGRPTVASPGRRTTRPATGGGTIAWQPLAVPRVGSDTAFATVHPSTSRSVGARRTLPRRCSRPSATATWLATRWSTSSRSRREPTTRSTSTSPRSSDGERRP